MRIISMAPVVLMMALSIVSGPAPCHAGWDGFVSGITGRLTTMWEHKEVNFMGSSCFYNQSPKMEGWKLRFRGNFSCPTWTKIRGYVITSSRTGVMRQTITDFIEKAKASGLVTEDEAQAWLNDFQFE